MKILHVIPSLNKGGAERLASDIVSQLKQRTGIEAQLVTFKADNAYAATMASSNTLLAPAYFIPSITGKSKVYIVPWMKIVDEFKPDVIHSHLFEAEMVTRHELRRESVYVSHCHDNMAQLKKLSFETLLSKKTLTNYYERSLLLKKYEACDNHFVVISRNTLNYMQGVLPSSLKNNVHLLHNAIHFKKFNSANHQRSVAEIKIVNTGSFIPLKNQILLVETLKVLKSRNVKATVTFLGNGPELEKVKAKAKEYGLQDQVIFAGNVDSVESYLRDANLYVNTSYSEGFGLVMVEAMAAGLPVIALDAGGNRDLIQEGSNGFMIYEQNPELFADRIISLMKDENLYRSISQNAVEFAKDFDMPTYIDRLLALYEQLLREKKLQR